jgi:3-hydroxyacyl-[acyl-carrier-protein] dehydratase
VKLLGKVTVDGAIACEATIMCMLVPRPGKKTAAEAEAQ